MRPPVRRRTRARELALQFLYMIELRGPEALNELEPFVDHHTKRGPERKAKKEVSDYARRLALGVQAHLEELNAWIEQIAENWRLDRMAHIDRNVLRLAIYELLHETDVPFKVVINEAIDIAKRYSTMQSGSFVNGILDRARVLIEQGRARGEAVPAPPPRERSNSAAAPPDPPPITGVPTPRPRARRNRPLEAPEPPTAEPGSGPGSEPPRGA